MRVRKKVRNRKRVLLLLKIGIGLQAAVLILLIGVRLLKPQWFENKKYVEQEGEQVDASKPEIDVQLLTVNPFSRPGVQTNRITGIVVHYTANPGSTAMDNRNYFEGLKDTQITKASSNFIVGLDGEIVQCVPTWEVAYASNARNIDTVSIECCHPDETGQFNDATLLSLEKLCAWLCVKFELNENDIIRHYDVTEKICPKYFVEHEDEWDSFKKEVGNALNKH